MNTETNTPVTNPVVAPAAPKGIKGRKPAVNAILVKYLRLHADRITAVDFADAAKTLADAQANPTAFRKAKEVAAPVAPEAPAVGSQTVTVTTDVA